MTHTVEAGNEMGTVSFCQLQKQSRHTLLVPGQRYQDGQKEEHRGLTGGVVGVPLVTRLSRGNGGSRGARAGMSKGQLRVSRPVIDSLGMVPTWQCHGSGKQSAPARPAVNDARSASRQPTAHHCCPSEANSLSCSVTLIIRFRSGGYCTMSGRQWLRRRAERRSQAQLHPAHPP